MYTYFRAYICIWFPGHNIEISTAVNIAAVDQTTVSTNNDVTTVAPTSSDDAATTGIDSEVTSQEIGDATTQAPAPIRIPVLATVNPSNAEGMRCFAWQASGHACANKINKM